MKNFFIIIFFLVAHWSIGQNESTPAIASCCLESRGCNGSAYCTACKNCSGCKHCAKNGGSCGVCSRSARNRNQYTANRNNKKSTVNSKKFIRNSLVIVNSQTLNLRSGPGSHYSIIEKLDRNQPLIIIEILGKWLKVRKKDSDKVGYVYDHFVQIE